MKKGFAIGIAAVLIVYLAGCQSTPEEPIVVGKGDNWLEEKITEQEDAALPSDLPESGTRIRETYRHDSRDITIEVDALVDTQDGKTMPAVKVSPHKFTQAEVDRVYEHYVGDAHFFRVPEGETWTFMAEMNSKDIEAQLEYEKANGSDEDYVQRLENRLKDARQEYMTAKDASEFPGVSHTLSKENWGSHGSITEGVHGYFEKDGLAYRFTAANDDNGMSSAMRLQRYSVYDLDVQFEERLGVSADISYLDEGESLREISYGDALALAEEAVNAFGAQGMALAHAEARQYSEDTLESYYTFIFTHEIGGVLCKYDPMSVGSDDGYNEPWSYEKLIVNVDAHGLKSAGWIAPCDITEQLSESTSMIPFEEVMNCFSKMAFIKNSYLENSLKMTITVTDIDGDSAYAEDAGLPDAAAGGTSYTVDSLVLHVDRITLGLMRVQSGSEYLLIPVWDFYGYQQLLTAEGEDISSLGSGEGGYDLYEVCLLTVNAIDGSVIDRCLGY